LRLRIFCAHWMRKIVQSCFVIFSLSPGTNPPLF
jgi:hypothetical protein